MRVEFDAAGVTLVGELRQAGPDAPALVLTGPFTGVKEQVVGRYAELLHGAGFTTLAFDHRGFGQSGGRRAHEDSQGKLVDLRAAVGLLCQYTGTIGIVGICLGGGYAVRAAAADPRIRVAVGIAGGYNSPSWLAERIGLRGYREVLAGFVERYDEELPAVAPGDGEAAMGGEEPFAYYGTVRSTAEHWENRVTRGSLHALMTFDALGAAPLLGETPLLVVHGRTDAYCAPELAQALYDGATGPKELRWLDAARHIDLYDQEPYVSEAVTATTAFLSQHLPGSAME